MAAGSRMTPPQSGDRGLLPRNRGLLPRNRGLLPRVGMGLISLILIIAAFAATTLTAGSEIAPSEVISSSLQPFSSWQPQGQTVHLVPALDPHLTGATNTAESTNWAGYADTGPTF